MKIREGVIAIILEQPCVYTNTHHFSICIQVEINNQASKITHFEPQLFNYKIPIF